MFSMQNTMCLYYVHCTLYDLIIQKVVKFIYSRFMVCNDPCQTCTLFVTFISAVCLSEMRMIRLMYFVKLLDKVSSDKLKQN